MPVWLIRYLPHIVAVTALAAGVWWFSHARYEAGYAAAEALWTAKAQEAADRYAEELAAQQRRLEVTEAALADARRQGRTSREELDNALALPEGRAWGDTPIPDAVRMSLDAARHPPVPTDPE